MILSKTKLPQLQLFIGTDLRDIQTRKQLAEMPVYLLSLYSSCLLEDPEAMISLLTHERDIFVHGFKSFIEFSALRGNETISLCDLINLESFPCCSSLSLRKVHLSLCPKLTTIVNFQNLESIVIINCFNLVDVSSFGNIPHLTLSDCYEILDISSLTNNQCLSILGCINIVKYPKLIQSKSLCCDWFQKIERPKSLPMLQKLRIENSKLTEHFLWFQKNLLFQVEIMFWNKLECLTGLAGVSVVIIASCVNLKDISSLSENKSVTLNWCPGVTSFASLKNVSVVNIKDCQGFTNGFDVENVKHLTIGGCFTFNDASMLGKLQSLSLSTKIDSFQGLGNIPDLKLEYGMQMTRNDLKYLGGEGNEKFHFMNVPVLGLTPNFLP
jgi:hypothetical protein